MRTISSAVPRHDEDDVPNVGPASQFEQIIQCSKMRLNPVVQKLIGSISTSLGIASSFLLKPLADHKSVVTENVVARISDDDDGRA